VIIAGFLLFSKKPSAGAPIRGSASLAARLSPPKRLFGLMSDIAPRQADVMKVTFIPLRQFKPLAPALSPDMQRLTEPGDKPRFMMIYHRLRRTTGHLNLLKLTYWQQYRPY
jgi:hypothetical protein